MKQDISVLGIDLAKNVFQVHGANAHGKRVLSKRVNRKELGCVDNSSLTH
jgi:transposase